MRLSIIALAACTAAPPGTGSTQQPVVTPHEIYVYATGTISPPITTIDPGEQVKFTFQTFRDSVIPATAAGGNPYPAICDQPKSWLDSDPNNFAGPMAQNVSGIFAINPNPPEPGLVSITSVNNPCNGAEVRGHTGNRWLCAQAPTSTVMDETWADPDLMGVYLRFNWVDLNPDEGVYTLEPLIAEVEKAVAHGKLYSISIEAGSAGTPDWIFDTSIEITWVGIPPQPHVTLVPRALGGGGVPRVKLQDKASNNQSGCGTEMYLGNPGDLEYGQHYNALLANIAATLKSNAAWYRALAYIKPSGANLFTAENRLPRRCDPGCLCNTQAWSLAGYTPAGLEAFYADQEANMNFHFPGKTMSYALIQDGFPRVDDGGGYVDANGVYIDGNGAAAPNSEIGIHRQTIDIIDHGQTTWTTSFAVQHNGLQPIPGDCIADPELPGCPNPFVIDAGLLGPTGFQTQNISDIDDNALLEAALDNAYLHSSATFIEIYEERSWESRIEGTLGAHTLGWWANRFHARRDPPLVELSYTITPERYPLGPAGNQTLYFIHGAKCPTNANAWGKIVIRP